MHEFSVTNYLPMESPQEGYLVHFEILDNKAVLFFHSDINFSVQRPFYPCFLLETSNVEGCENFIRKQYDTKKIEIIQKTDLSEFNHLNQPPKNLLKIYFSNQNNFTEAKNKIKKILKKEEQDIYKDFSYMEREAPFFINIYEHDIPFDNLFLIENDLRVGKWYKVDFEKIVPSEKIAMPSLRILAFDIETTKEPLLFPDSSSDQIMMISLVCDKGYLIVNREIVDENISDFSYWPKSDIGSNFEVFNEKDEKNLLLKFYEIIHLFQPEIFTTYNGDFFDIPFLIERSNFNDLKKFTNIFSRSIEEALKIKSENSEENEEISILKIIHLDAYKWVKRDSYLPMGSQGLKNVTQVKLNYQPEELDPELLVSLAKENPQLLANYSVSDSVACYLIYVKYVNLFIFSLCTLIPLNSLDVLEKGSGTLCESLLIAQAYKKGVLIPDKNKVIKHDFPFVINNLNYVGGHVESIRSGIYRHDFEYEFNLHKNYLVNLLEKMNFKEEFIKEIKDLGKEEILKINSKPFIYHLDVGAMYPNIILTNKLQPVAVKTEEDCLRCDYFTEKEKCQRNLKWVQRIEYFPPTKKEIEFINEELENEMFFSEENKRQILFKFLPNTKKEQIFKKRLKEYSREKYKKLFITKEEEKTSTICQREIPFYLETVQSFRDQRVKYKKLSKTDKVNSQIYDSLQIAHKVVLNSFYGYVMRKGSRWYSLEMAAITCYQGAEIIKVAKNFIEKIGLVLELDTDGIWCLVPDKLPLFYENENILKIIINELIKERFSNDQYYINDSENNLTKYNSIEFEIDGPYNAMILPSSTEENKLLKKKYLIINKKNEISELKGFEIKRRGELNLIKKFQDDLFNKFTLGSNLEECYSILGHVCEYWLNLITSKASNLTDDEVFSFFSESKSMSKEIDEYDNQNVINASIANRLSEILGKKILKSGLKCEYVICDAPGNIANKAVPLQTFKFTERKRDFFLQRWINKTGTIKEILDWEYYRNRVSNVILKIVVLPAIFQKINNPVKSIDLPKWSVKESNLDSFLTSSKNKEIKNISFFTNEEKKNNNISDINNNNISDININSISDTINNNNNITFLSELVKLRKDYWLFSYKFILKNNLKDNLIIQEENNENYLISMTNNKLKKEKLFYNNTFFIELFDYNLEDSLETFFMDKKEIKLLEVKDNKSKHQNEYINHLAVKNIYFKEIPYFCKLNYKHKRIGNDFDYFIITSFTYEKRIFYILSVKNSKKINDFNYFLEKKENIFNEQLVFVNSKYLNYKILNNKSLLFYKDTHLAFYTDNNSKNILQEYFSVNIKEKNIKEKNINLLGSLEEIIEEYKKIHLKINEKIEKQNEISKLTNVNLLSINDLDFLFYQYLMSKKVILNSNKEYYNYFNNTNCVKGYYDYCIMIGLKNTLIYSILEEKEGIFYDFFKLLFNKKDSFYLKKVEEWIKYKSKIIPENLKNKLIINQSKYIINQIKVLKEIKIECVLVNNNILIINTKKKSKSEEFINYLKNKLEIEIIREFDQLAIINEHSYIYKSKNKIKAFGNIIIPEEIAVKYFNNEPIENDLIYKLIIKENVNHFIIKNILEILKLKEEVNVLENNCHKLLKKSLFLEKESFFKLNLICKCKNDNVIFTNGTNKVFCYKCYYQITNDLLDEALIKKYENELSLFLKNEIYCNNCKENKRRVLQNMCKCGYIFKENKFVIEEGLARTDKGRIYLREINNFNKL